MAFFVFDTVDRSPVSNDSHTLTKPFLSFSRFRKTEVHLTMQVQVGAK